MAIGGFSSPRITELEKRLKKDPSSLIFVQLAEEYRRSGANEQAIQICRDGLLRHPTYISANMLLGRVYFEMRRFKEARTELEKVIVAAPENLMAHRMLGDIHWQDESWESAEKQYRMVFLLNPSDVECGQRLRIIEGKLREIQRHVQFALDVPAIGHIGPNERVPVPGVDVPLIDVQSYGEMPHEMPEPAKPLGKEKPAEAAPGTVVLAPGLEEIKVSAREPPADVGEEIEPEKPAGFYAVRTEEERASGQVVADLDDTTVFPSAFLDQTTTQPVGEQDTAIEPPQPAQAEQEETVALVKNILSRGPDVLELPGPAQPRTETQPIRPPQAELATITLAELYASQGYYEKAAEVYRVLLERAHGDAWLELKLREMEARITHKHEAVPAKELTGEAKIAILQRWLAAIRLNQMPVAVAGRQ